MHLSAVFVPMCVEVERGIIENLAFFGIFDPASGAPGVVEP